MHKLFFVSLLFFSMSLTATKKTAMENQAEEKYYSITGPMPVKPTSPTEGFNVPGGLFGAWNDNAFLVNMISAEKLAQAALHGWRVKQVTK